MLFERGLARTSLKRGGGVAALSLDEDLLASIRFRFNKGLDVETVAEIHGIAPRTVYDDLTVAKGELRRALNRA